MTELKISEINVTNILIVIMVGVGGIFSIVYGIESLAIACFSGLVGYLGKSVQNKYEENSYSDCGDETVWTNRT